MLKMRKLLILLCICLGANAQFPYRTLSEACTANTVNSGITNRATKFYASTFAVGQYAFADNIPSSTRRLQPGIYYTNKDGLHSAFQINKAGQISAIQACSGTGGGGGGGGPVVVNPNGKLQYSVSTSPNIINWSQYPNFTLPSSMRAVYGWGAPMYSNETGIPTDALAKGWSITDGADAVSSALLPLGKAIKWLHVEKSMNDDVSQELMHEGLSEGRYFRYSSINLNAISNATAYRAGQLFYYKCWGAYDPAVLGNGVRIGNVFMNQEEDTWSQFGNATRGRVTAQIIKGMHSQKETRPLTVSVYGAMLSNYYGSFNQAYISGQIGYSELAISPYYNDTEIANFKKHSGFLNSTFNATDTPNTFAGVSLYFKVPYPTDEPLYDINPSTGAYVMVNGKRKWRSTNYTTNVFGESVNIYATPQDGAVAYYPAGWIVESAFAVRQMYIWYDQLVFNRYALRDYYAASNDLSNLDNFDVKLEAIQRDETEGTFYSLTQKSRPLNAQVAEFFVGVCYGTGIRAHHIWTDYSPRTHPSQNLPSAAKPYGQNYYSIASGTSIPKRWGFFEAETAALKYITDINTQYQFFDGTEKVVLGTQVADKTHEIILCGALRGNKLWLFATAPYFDKTDKTNVTVTNSMNSSTYTFEVKGRENSWQVIELPAGSYTTGNIRFQYLDELGTTHKVTGNLNSHTW